MGDKFTDALHQAQDELAILEARKAALLRLIDDLKALAADDSFELQPPADYVPKGITDEIRTILRLTTVHLDTVQIRDSLLRRGFEKSNPKNLLIAVHTVLNRIRDELDVIERDGKPAYRARMSQAVRDVFMEAAKELLPPPRSPLPPILRHLQGKGKK